MSGKQFGGGTEVLVATSHRTFRRETPQIRRPLFVDGPTRGQLSDSQIAVDNAALADIEEPMSQSTVLYAQRGASGRFGLIGTFVAAGGIREEEEAQRIGGPIALSFISRPTSYIQCSPMFKSPKAVSIRVAMLAHTPGDDQQLAPYVVASAAIRTTINDS